ncbi:MAG: hypothetical protein MGG11_03670 [Trichodesmium sp. MAG_R03]|nr:hypothetical protein [Trichodesmium sp. MAG_R03]
MTYPLNKIGAPTTVLIPKAIFISLGILMDKLSFQQDTFTFISILENLDRHNFEIVLYYFSITNDMVVVLCQKVDLSKN